MKVLVVKEAADVLSREERRFLNRRSDDLRILSGEARAQITLKIRRIFYVALSLYFIRTCLVFYIVNDIVASGHAQKYLVDGGMMIVRLTVLLIFIAAYQRLLDESRWIKSISIVAIAMSCSLIWQDSEWLYLTLSTESSSLFFYALMLRLSSLFCLIWSHKLLVDRDG
ncbi:MAG: hypothetical protein QMC05_01430 [Pseudomonadales bacterium]